MRIVLAILFFAAALTTTLVSFGMTAAAIKYTESSVMSRPVPRLHSALSPYDLFYPALFLWFSVASRFIERGARSVLSLPIVMTSNISLQARFAGATGHRGGDQRL